MLDNHIKIGSQFHSKNDWANFSERELLEMDDKDSVKWFLKNKNWLLNVGG